MDKDKVLERIEEQRNKQKVFLMMNMEELDKFLLECQKVDKNIDRTIEIVLG